jgi:CDP-glycerol glycerophosphotransferase (TagB/SpsB family)
VAGGKPDMEATKLQLIRLKLIIVSLLNRIISPFANTLFSAQPNTLLIPYNPEFRYKKSDQTTTEHFIERSLPIEPFSGNPAEKSPYESAAVM